MVLRSILRLRATSGGQLNANRHIYISIYIKRTRWGIRSIPTILFLGLGLGLGVKGLGLGLGLRLGLGLGTRVVIMVTATRMIE